MLWLFVGCFLMFTFLVVSVFIFYCLWFFACCLIFNVFSLFVLDLVLSFLNSLFRFIASCCLISNVHVVAFGVFGGSELIVIECVWI